MGALGKELRERRWHAARRVVGVKVQRVCLLRCEAQGPGGSAPLLHSNLVSPLRQRCRGAQSGDVWELVSKRGIAFAPVLQPALVPGDQTGVLEVTVLVQKLTELFVVLAYRQRLTVGTSEVLHVLLHCALQFFYSLICGHCGDRADTYIQHNICAGRRCDDGEFWTGKTGSHHTLCTLYTLRTRTFVEAKACGYKDADELV